MSIHCFENDLSLWCYRYHFYWLHGTQGWATDEKVELETYTIYDLRHHKFFSGNEKKIRNIWKAMS